MPDWASGDRPPTADEILDNLATAVLIVATDGTIMALNAGAEDLLGMSARHGISRPLQAVIPGLRNVSELVRRAATRGEFFGHVLSLAVPHRSATPIEVACHVSPLRGFRDRVVVELSDATPWRQIDREHALITQRDASRRMIRQLAHEIRNPLGGLRGAAQLLERELPTPELREYTRIIIGEADRLTALTESLLGPVRRPTRRDVNVHEVIERVLALIASERHDTVQLIRDYDPSLPTLSADPDQLMQALLNIARNAVESLTTASRTATDDHQALRDDGQVTIRTRALSNFSIGAERHKLILSIEIEDNGPGVPEDLAEAIFYPLVTGRTNGTGLGLAISQDLVSRHGGLIEYQSRPKRTVFTVRLPVQNSPREAP